MKSLRKNADIGDLVYHKQLGAGIVVHKFKIRKGRPNMLSVLFGPEQRTVWDANDLKVIQLKEREADGSLCVVDSDLQ